jgi:protein TonB
MSVQIFNDLPDVAVHRGDPHERRQRPASVFSRVSGRAWFAVATLVLHLIAIAAFLTDQQTKSALPDPEPMLVSLVETSATPGQPRDIAPPPHDITFVLEPPQDVTYETESITPAPITPSTAIADADPATLSPPVVESVEYVRAPAPVYPADSSRRRERGTVLLRVLVDEAGRPALIQLERSSGFPRLDDAARAAVQQALFRPYEVNGVAQPAQVLIPIEFTRRS